MRHSLSKSRTGLGIRLLSLFLPLVAGCGGGGGGGAPATGPGPSPPPGIASVTPADNETGVPLDAPIRVVFDKDMDPATVTTATISLRSGGAPVSGSLRYGTQYEVTVTTGVRDLDGNPPHPYTWRFTTEAAPPFLAGVLRFDGNAKVSYDAPTRSAMLEGNALHPLAGILVKAVRPSSDNNATLIAEGSASAASSGAFSFPGLPPGKWLIVAEGIFPTGSVRRILGVSFTDTSGAPLLHYISMTDVTPDASRVRLDAFCLDCHPSIDNVTRPGQIYRDAHVSGAVPVTAFPWGCDEYGRVTCNSCHSVHDPTGYPHFLLGSGGVFCNRCHHS